MRSVFLIKSGMLVVYIVLFSLASVQAAQNVGEGRSMKILTVGNSFSQNACQYLSELAKAGGHTLVLWHADIGGCPLNKHIELARIADADPSDPAGKPYGRHWSVTSGDNPGPMSLRDALIAEKWDIVTIQQKSLISNDYSTYQPYASQLCDYIRKYAPQAEIVVHETWAYRRDDPQFATDSYTQEKMYNEVSNAYRRLARELGLRMIPVGDAFYAADTNAVWGYKPVSFDRAQVVYPSLPDQTHSLHAGWFWARNAEGTNTLEMDGHHANSLGCYLAGCVWYEFLFKESVVENTYIPSEIPPTDAKFLRRIASEAVALSAR